MGVCFMEGDIVGKDLTGWQVKVFLIVIHFPRV